MEETRDVRSVSHFGMEPLSKFDIRERHMLVSYVQQAESFRLLQRVMEDVPTKQQHGPTWRRPTCIGLSTIQANML